jgi:hypothetical protein
MKQNNHSVISLISLVLFILLVKATVSNANLIRNPGFEDVPNANWYGQGLMPSEWITVNITPDTYSEDGSYGLLPTAESLLNPGGTFTGVTAQEGIRWVAGWSIYPETFGQLLITPLSPGQQYEFSGYMIQAKRTDIDNPGGYELWLAADNDTPATGYLGRLEPTTDSDEWEFRTLTFTAPQDADNLPFLLFVPYDTGTGGAYPGLDSVMLVPEPATVLLLSLGGLMLLRKRNRL